MTNKQIPSRFFRRTPNCQPCLFSRDLEGGANAQIRKCVYIGYRICAVNHTVSTMADSPAGKCDQCGLVIEEKAKGFKRRCLDARVKLFNNSSTLGNIIEDQFGVMLSPDRRRVSIHISLNTVYQLFNFCIPMYLCL